MRDESPSNERTTTNRTPVRSEPATVGRVVPDHELTTVGVGNINRSFFLDDNSNAPTSIARSIVAYAAFTYGFSASAEDGISVGDTLAATDTSVPNVPDPDTGELPNLYPVTRVAKAVEEDVWPVLQNLFSSGTGQRYPIAFSEFVRYQAMLQDAYSWMYNILQINNLAYHFNWEKVYPYSGTVPPYIYDMAVLFDATDVGLASRWLPLMKRFSSKIMFPVFALETKRMLSPMLSIDLNGRLLIPMRFNPLEEGLTADYVYGVIKGYLDYIDTDLTKAAATLQSFLPFPMMAIDPWEVQSEPAVDVDRATGWYNSGTYSQPTFGDTGEGDEKSKLFFKEGFPTAEPPIYWYSRVPAPTWAEMKLGSVWVLNYHLVDNTFELLTPHLLDKVWIPTDGNAYVEYANDTYSEGSEEERYEDFVSDRFVNNRLTDGSMEPGYLGAEISLLPLHRLARLEVDHAFSVKTLKLVTIQAAGSSLRELRFTIARSVNESLGLPEA